MAHKKPSSQREGNLNYAGLHEIHPRMNLNFGLDQDIPKYWFGGDPFLSRMFDALSVVFPHGERYFIACVRDFREQVKNAELEENIKNFTRQEGQHGQAHERHNQRLREQGIKIDLIQAAQVRILFEVFRRYLPKSYTLALTAAAEHLTATMAASLTSRREILSQIDPRLRSLLVWHAMEEVEHKAVAFDVMRDVAHVGYALRVLAMVQISFEFPMAVFYITSKMLKADGYSLEQRRQLMLAGVRRELKPQGLLGAIRKRYLAYYRPGFHPNQADDGATYEVWIERWNRTQDATAASDAVLEALAA